MFVENVVLGSSLKALEFAERVKATVIYKTLSCPLYFENEFSDWKTKFVKSCLEGKIRFHDRVSAILVKEKDQALEIRTKSFMKYNVSYEKLFVFGSDDVTLSSAYPTSVSTRNFVYDWYELTSVNNLDDLGFIMNIPKIEDAWLYDNKLITKMNLESSELHDISFSDTYYKFLIQNAMTESNLRGRKNGFTSSGEQKYLSLEISSIKRDVKTISDVSYPSIKNLEFFYD